MRSNEEEKQITVTYKFHLPDNKHELDVFQNAERFYSVLLAIDDACRELIKHDENASEETGRFAERIRDLIVSRRKQTIKRLKQRLDYEQRNLLYVCDEGHTPVTFSDAFEFGFLCTVCGQEIFCDKCGVDIPEDALFCISCGDKVKKSKLD